MPQPVMLVLDDEEDSLRHVEAELRRRYGADYEIIALSSAGEALERLQALKQAAREVVIVFADQMLPDMDGREVLMHVHEMLPETKRVLLVDLGDISCAGTLLQALTFGQADEYITKPYKAPDEEFHRAVSALLGEWAQAHRERFQFLRVIGEPASPRSYELRDLIHRSGIPGVFYDAHSPEGSSLLKAVEQSPPEALPVCVLYNAMVLVDPSDEEIAQVIGVQTRAGDQLFDLVILGAGPAGLSAAVYGASEGLNVLVVEPDAPGGQAGTSSMVRNYLGFPRGIGGGDLMRQAYRQAWLFQARFVFAYAATALRAEGEERIVTLESGENVRARAVLLSMGIAYRTLQIPAIDGLLGAGVYYSTAVSEAQAMRDKQVYVVGAGNSAGQAAVYLAKYARQVTMLARGGSMAASMSDYLLKETAAAPNIAVHMHTEVVDGWGDQVLEGIVVRDNATGQVSRLPADALFVLIGGDPHTGWLPESVRRDRQGYILTGRDLQDHPSDGPAWPLERPPLPLETSMPGVFAAGDVRHGAPKRIAAAVGEGSVAIGYVHEYLATLEAGNLQRAEAAVRA